MAIYTEGDSAPHFGLVFSELPDHVQGDFRISGVFSPTVYFLGDHNEIQNWDFVKINSIETILLIPKRYVIFTFVVATFAIHLTTKKE